MIEEPKPAEPGFFRLELEKSIRILAHGQHQNRTGLGNDRQVSVAHGVGGRLPCGYIEKHWIRLIWTERWSPAGLTPVKPSVVFATDFQLSPARAVMIAGVEV